MFESASEDGAQMAKRIDKSIGGVGEDFVRASVEVPFGEDFVFPNPPYRTPKGDIELCDVLILFDDIAVLVEVKTADRQKRPNRSEVQWAAWGNTRLAGSIGQIERGIEAIREGLVTEVENDRQGRVRIDSSKIKQYFAIAVLDHPTLDKYGRGPVITVGGVTVCVMSTTHTELLDILRELSTIGDLVDYLLAREAFFAKNAMVGVTELDLLAHYKRDPDEFRSNVAEYDRVVVEEGSWESFCGLEARRRRDEANRPSRLVDSIIDRLHEGRNSKLPHIEERYAHCGLRSASGSYQRIAVELARLRRVDRRVIGEVLLEKSAKCLEQGRDRCFALAPDIEGEGVALVFMVSTGRREDRLAVLEGFAVGALLKNNARRVVGVATEPVGVEAFSVDAVLIDADPEDLRSKLPQEVAMALEAQFASGALPTVTEFDAAEEGAGC